MEIGADVNVDPAGVRRPDECSDAELVADIRECEGISRHVLVRQLESIAEAERRGLSARCGARTTSTWLRDLLNLAESDAKSRVLVAQQAAPGGEGRPEAASAPDLPATAEVLRTGETSVAHGRVIVEAMRKLPPSTGSDQRETAEAMLAEQSRTLSPRQLRKLAEELRCELDQEGAAWTEQYQLEHRALHVGTGWDGMTVLNGRLDRETGARLRAVLEPLAAPHPEEDGTRDPRSAARRNADALESLLATAPDGDQNPAESSGRPQITVTINHEDLNRQALAPTGGRLEPTGQPVTAATARRIACDAEVLPLVLGGQSQPLDVGKARRTAPAHLRSALLVRDGRCAFPRCDQPPGTPEAHHVQHWADGGPTAIHNMVMVCAHHHRVLHHKDWQVELPDGKPVFVPPARVDPRRRPRPATSPRPPDQRLVRAS